MWGLWESRHQKEQKRASQEAKRQKRLENIINHNTANFKRGGIAVVISGGAAMLAAFACRRSIIIRRYVPGKFDANILPPKFNPMTDAARAIIDASLLAGSTVGLITAASLWMFGVGNLKELGAVLTAKYSPKRNGIETDEESRQVEKQLTDLFFSKPSGPAR